MNRNLLLTIRIVFFSFRNLQCTCKGKINKILKDASNTKKVNFIEENAWEFKEQESRKGKAEDIHSIFKKRIQNEDKH